MEMAAAALFGMTVIVVLFFWLMASVMVGFAASARNLNGLAWGVLAFLMSPPFTVLCLIATPVKPTGEH